MNAVHIATAVKATDALELCKFVAAKKHWRSREYKTLDVVSKEIPIQLIKQPTNQLPLCHLPSTIAITKNIRVKNTVRLQAL